MSLIVILVIMVVLWLLVEILSVVFKMTGLELYKARFQIISIITHTGFTTRESELITQHSLRRRLTSILMIVSYVAQVTLISLFVNILINNQRQLIYAGALLLLCTLFIVIITRTEYVSDKFNIFVEKLLSKRIASQKKMSIDQVLKLSKDFGVFEFVLDEDNPYCNLKLSDSNLSNKQIHILKVDRGSNTVDFPDADFTLNQGDRLVIYGRTSSVTEIALGKVKKTA